MSDREIALARLRKSLSLEQIKDLRVVIEGTEPQGHGCNFLGEDVIEEDVNETLMRLSDELCY